MSLPIPLHPFQTHLHQICFLERDMDLGKKVGWNGLFGVLSRHVDDRIVLPNKMFGLQRNTERAGDWYVRARGILRRNLCLSIVEGRECISTTGDDGYAAFLCVIKRSGATFFATKTTWFHPDLWICLSLRAGSMHKSIPRTSLDCSHHTCEQGYVDQRVRAWTRGYRPCCRGGTQPWYHVVKFLPAEPSPGHQ